MVYNLIIFGKYILQYITQVVVQFFEEGLNSDKQSIKTIQTLFLWLNIPPHIRFHQIPYSSGKKKSCDPLFHLALFHFRRSLDRRGSRWERCCECFKTVCNHLSKINRRSTRIKSKFLRVGWLGVVGKGLYYHRFVDVLRHGKWDEMG